MAKVTKEHYEQHKKDGKSIAQVAQDAGVTKQAVVNMFKKYSSESIQQE